LSLQVPVLMFHGTDDVNVRFYQSQMMERALSAAGVRHELVTFDGLDHGLEDSTARANMLRRSDAFLRAAFAPGPPAPGSQGADGVESPQK
jgi:dipeptidyl aminopeptidase/acylaminoacyl peptidase